MNLTDGSGRIGCMVKHSMGIYEVKSAVRERQVLRIALNEPSFQICQLKAPSRYANCRVRQVNRGVMSTSANEQFGLAAASANDLQYSQAAALFKADCRSQTWMHFIPVLVEALIESD